MHETSDSMYQDAARERLLVRLQTPSARAIDLKKRLYGEVVAWMQRQGFDVARQQIASGHAVLFSADLIRRI